MKNNKQIIKQNTFSKFLLYTTPNGKVKVEIFLHDENIWLTQMKIAKLFGVERSVITKHLQNIFKEGELNKVATCAKIAQVQNEGKRQVTRDVEFYNLDAIISVGYRVNSVMATNFRIWATERLKEYIIKGFTMDDERLKNPNTIFGQDYFEEQLARIRDIRSSERRFNERNILEDNGKISHEVAVVSAESEYEKYRKKQDKNYISDFDRAAKKLMNNKFNNKNNR
ncbi:MAG: RhuM family protein [Patescibacteria group bacterium]